MQKKRNFNLEDIVDKIMAFREKRDWEQFHNPKNLAISISLEASELLEQFQWKDFDESIKYAKENKEKISSEISDILIYIMYLCSDLDIDIKEAVNKKIESNDQKYPVSKSKGKSNKHDQLS